MDRHGLNVELWLFIAFAQAVKQIKTSHHALRKRHLRQRQQGVAVELGRSLNEVGKGFNQRTLGFIDLVEHSEAHC